MAYRVTQRIISSDDLLYPYFDDLCRKSKLLYNAALFRVRNIFTGYDKEHRTENEVEVFQEVALLQRSYPNMHVRRVISYTHIEKMMRVTENADFFSGLPRQTAQQMVKQSVTDFKNWLASLREYKKHPEKYLGKPKMPRYKKSDLTTVIITNQDAVLYRDDIGMSLKLPLQKQRLYFSNLSSDPVLKEVKIKPYYGRFLLCLTLEEPDVAFDPSGSHVCAIDLGYVLLILEQITSQRSYVMITHPQYTKAELSYPRSNGSINREQSMSPSSQKVMKRNTLFPSG